jgi:hypothetical protein
MESNKTNERSEILFEQKTSERERRIKPASVASNISNERSE